jgi:hypothetical protein
MEVIDWLEAPAALLPGEKAPDSYRIEGWVDPRSGLDAVEKGKIIIPDQNRTTNPRLSSS